MINPKQIPNATASNIEKLGGVGKSNPTKQVTPISVNFKLMDFILMRDN